MKISGARTEAFSATRRRALARDDAQAVLGLDETELTPGVQDALKALLIEIDDLRGEVGRLKHKLTEVEGLADRDALTPLLNRRAFVRELGRIAAFAQRYGAPACLAYFDLDGFKSVNDRFGHAAGDAALRAVAGRLLANVRESDVVGRLGGDEFAVILVQADLAAAAAKAEALARVVEEIPVECGDWSVPLHISYGVREIAPGADPEVALAEADATMFVRKRGREERG